MSILYYYYYEIIMKKEGAVLVVDDNKAILTALKMLLPIYFEKVETLPSPNSLIKSVTTTQFDVVLLDMNFKTGINSGNEGLYWLTEIKKHSPYTEVVLFTAYGEIDVAVEAIKRGGFDFIEKPFENAKLVATLSAACQLSASKREVKELKEIKREIKTQHDIFWGTNPKMLEVKNLIDKIAVTDVSVLITGENGTGKDVIATEIHNKSLRARESMVRVDVGSLTETLFESELFGHVKGAFTDAHSDRAGKFEVANSGSLFLDEIGNIPLHLQSKLLTVLQNRIVTRVGSNISKPVDVRLICATNKNIFQMAISGEFREDLLYRINTIHITIPPLRERVEDIVPLAEMFVKRYAAKYSKAIESIDESAAAKLQNYSWKGNIRELQHAVEKAIILCDGNELCANDFLLQTSEQSNRQQLFTTIEDMEKEMIYAAFHRHSGNISLVASELGITRQTLYNKLKKYDI